MIFRRGRDGNGRGENLKRQRWYSGEAAEVEAKVHNFQIALFLCLSSSRYVLDWTALSSTASALTISKVKSSSCSILEYHQLKKKGSPSLSFLRSATPSQVLAVQTKSLSAIFPHVKTAGKDSKRQLWNVEECLQKAMKCAGVRMLGQKLALHVSTAWMHFWEYLRKCAKSSRVAFLGTSKNI